MILYGNLGMDKRLRDIVFAGSHDAGITTGGGNAQTQSKDIYGQAKAGVRIFDLRVMATVHGTLNPEGELRTYHAGGGIQKIKRHVRMQETGSKEHIVQSKLGVGNFGLGLEGILTDARKFVRDNASEFLILKFDKCTNWSLIARYCIQFLGSTIYTDGGDINRKTLQDLKGKVLVAFSEKGFLKLQGAYGPGDGILKIRNLFAKDGGPKAYDTTYDGIQYFGKGGTSVNPVTMKWSHHGKIAENEEKQAGLMSIMSLMNGDVAHSSDVLGMLYWTSTGLQETISERDEKMWTHTGRDNLVDLWESVLGDALKIRLAQKRVKTTDYASGTWMKTFMPNIIMIDFAEKSKCRTIYGLNRIAATELTHMAQLHG